MSTYHDRTDYALIRRIEDQRDEAVARAQFAVLSGDENPTLQAIALIDNEKTNHA